MIFISGFGGDDESAPNHNGAKHVREGFDRIGDERMRMTEYASRKLATAKPGIYHQTEQSRSPPSFEPFVRHRGKARRAQRKNREG